MLNNFIYAQSKAMFEERIAEVPNEAIVFIEDTKEIWTHGTYFDCSTLDPSIIPNIQTEIDELRMSFNNKADIDGNYPDMTVGFAEDLGGAEFTQESGFTIRATADGETVKDGAARIESVKGNSVVWNQWAKPFEEAFEKPYYDDGISYNGNKVTIDNWRAYNPFRFDIKASYAKNHIYLVLLNYSNTNPDQLIYIEFGGENSIDRKVGNIAYFHRNIIYNNAYKDAFTLYLSDTMEGTITLSDLQVIDLTKMFGTGNEPTTIEEFYARIPMGVDLNAYNEGEVIHMDAQSIESVGVNAFDNVWESGDISGTTGADYDNANTIRTGYISVIPGETYYITIPGKERVFMRARLYDANHSFIGITSSNGADIYSSQEFTLPSNAHYIRFAPNVSNITVDDLVCLNISNASLNGQYFPYVKNTQNLDIVVNYFPDGMKSVGNVYDEIRYNKATGKWEAVKRIGEAVMDSFNWAYQGVSADYPYGFFYTDPNLDLTDKAIGGEVLCKLYSGGGFDVNKSIASNASNKMVYVRDSSYTDVESFKTAMSGIILYYELATPIITEIEDPGFSYQVWNGGTEQVVASNSAPFKADITYNFSANEWIKQNRFDIEKLNTSLGTHYGVCDTAVDTAAKTVTVGGNFSLVTGAQVVVKFNYGNTADTIVTLNVNNTGAKTITWGSYSGARFMNIGEVLTFVYDGTNWYCKSSSAALTSGNVNMGHNLQTINSNSCGLAICMGGSAARTVDGALYIASNTGSTNTNAIYCANGNIVTATGAVQGNIVHNTRTITATTTLDAKDNIVYCNNYSTIDVNIKMDQVLPGQIFTIIKSTTPDIIVRTRSATNSAVSRLRILDTTTTTTAASHALSGIGVWNLYRIGDYICLYKL